MDVFPIPGFSEPVSCWSHLLAAALAALGSVVLVKKGKGNGPRVFSLILFSFSLVFLFSMSGVYHLLEPGGPARAVLQRLDHAAIWVLIAGTFTPIHVILFRGPWRWGILLAVWTIAITGLVLEVVFFADFPEWLSLMFFLGLGWIGAFTGMKFKQMFDDQSFRLLLGGGLFYSLGAVFDFVRWPTLWPGVIGAHELFHFFVMGGSLSHWLFIYHWCRHPLANRMIFHVRIFPNNRLIAQAVGEAILVEAGSIEALKIEIRREVAARYHHRIQPTIHLRYFQEEQL